MRKRTFLEGEVWKMHVCEHDTFTRHVAELNHVSARIPWVTQRILLVESRHQELAKLWAEWTKAQSELICLAVEIVGVKVPYLQRLAPLLEIHLEQFAVLPRSLVDVRISNRRVSGDEIRLEAWSDD